MKHRYRNILIGAAISAVLGTTGLAFAHGGNYDSNWKHGDQQHEACGMAGSAMGMGGHMIGMMGKGMMGQGMGHGMMGQGMMGGMQRGMGLDLSDEQKAQMVKMREEFLPLMGELRGKMQANHEQMQALRQGGMVDEAAIATLADRKGELMAEMIKMHSRHQAKMQSFLTEEQREQMQQRHQGMGMMWMQQNDE